MSGSYFELLGLPERFDLARPAIEAAYLDRTREVHPDRFATAAASERVAALQRSMQLNDAYQTLRQPVRRAEYLLNRHGVFIGDNERLDDAAFLMEILELREELAEARVAGKLDEVARLQAEMRRRHRGLLDALIPLFAAVEGDDAAGRADALPRVKRTLIELRYLARYLEECDAALDDEEA
ncbi:MAG: Fe-S protein assembly co-chaperone HscB [Kofleriaceae bacterium]|nr:Fe-S protein assembly co-chaperone HscB [Myxococcales bacterium]MCB9563327.1 Fe-S protein assembly co-chaperone HscB [Kofleriaceae bacterium]MCB9572252.1 Fe-S protein assembly co-chaperone HscB [Kofleriaceae bacterium]